MHVKLLYPISTKLKSLCIKTRSKITTWCILIDCLRFCVPLKNLSLYDMEMSPLPVKGCKIYIYTQRFGTELGLLCDTGSHFSGLILRIAPIQSPLTTHKRMLRTHCNLDFHGLMCSVNLNRFIVRKMKAKKEEYRLTTRTHIYPGLKGHRRLSRRKIYISKMKYIIYLFFLHFRSVELCVNCII
jgi:hypothetical protein